MSDSDMAHAMHGTGDRRALITGATGFIGGHLARRLHHDGWDVHALARGGAQDAALRQLLGESRVHNYDGTMAAMQRIVQAVRPPVIFHLASLFLAQHRAEDVPALVRSNVEFGAQLAEAAAALPGVHLINTGTAWQHFRDEDYSPVNFYAATKQALVDILRYYAETGALRVTHLELFDTYGPGDRRPKLFAALREAAAAGTQLKMSGGEQMIDMVYVDDVVNAYLAAADMALSVYRSALSVSTYAVSSGNPLRLRDVVETWQRVMATTGRSLQVAWGARPYHPRQVMHPWARGLAVPGWLPIVNLEEGIRRMEGVGR